jgi:hypothetical protein
MLPKEAEDQPLKEAIAEVEVVAAIAADEATTPLGHALVKARAAAMMAQLARLEKKRKREEAKAEAASTFRKQLAETGRKLRAAMQRVEATAAAVADPTERPDIDTARAQADETHSDAVRATARIRRLEAEADEDAAGRATARSANAHAQEQREFEQYAATTQTAFAQTELAATQKRKAAGQPTAEKSREQQRIATSRRTLAGELEEIECDRR